MAKTRKGLSAGIAVSLSLTLLAGCSASGTNTPPSSASAGSSGDSSSGVPTKQTFTALNYSNPSWPYNKDNIVWKLIEEKTGVSLNVQVPSGKLEDALSVTIASGNLPDLMLTMNKQLADKYGQQGALVNILDYVKDMPNLKKWMDTYPTDTQNVMSSDGKMYMFPNAGIGETNRMIWLYREDVFKKLGLSQPQTWDELYTTLKKLKEANPKSYPLSFRNGLQRLLNFAETFGTSSDMYYDFDKKEWRYGPIEDNYKKMIEYLNKFYKEGLIPPDFLSVDTKLWQDLMSTERAFITIDYIGRVDFFNSALRKDNPQYNLAFMAPPAGFSGAPRRNAYTQYVDEGFMVSTTSKKIKEIMKFMDFFYSEEGKTLASWGKEGVTFKTENGKKQFIETYGDVADMRKKTGLSTDGTYAWFDYDAHLSLSSPELQKAYQEAPKYDSKQQPRPAFTTDEMETLSLSGDTITKKRDENITKFIVGERSLDDWPKYVSEMKALGLDKIVDIYKKAYERSSKTSR
ncbi:sugar ABC transporter permease [Paenibacillus sp. J31TS4]|uniref:extracellular solute-binding protein n=1 Tax=Paenibacillus sp. J31TS4 TaxID=2807195 RepID=UPI001B1CB0B4|nr:extracellular solute-binding protein [Paenibacillus sp. J31TS4]GIP38686.1 sugar ABC transporter permease [Paenibacillus sp. J31TS4]